MQREGWAWAKKSTAKAVLKVHKEWWVQHRTSDNSPLNGAYLVLTVAGVYGFSFAANAV